VDVVVFRARVLTVSHSDAAGGIVSPSLNVGAMRRVTGELIPQGASTINHACTVGGAVDVVLCSVACLDYLGGGPRRGRRCPVGAHVGAVGR